VSLLVQDDHGQSDYTVDCRCVPVALGRKNWIHIGGPQADIKAAFEYQSRSQQVVTDPETSETITGRRTGVGVLGTRSLTYD
jgi:hypothetical protein